MQPVNSLDEIPFHLHALQDAITQIRSLILINEMSHKESRPLDQLVRWLEELHASREALDRVRLAIAEVRH